MAAFKTVNGCGKYRNLNSKKDVIDYILNPYKTPHNLIGMCMELEIDKGGERNDYAESILNTANLNNEHLYAKHDGSIDDGFELVSHPMTLEYHTNIMDWSDIMDMALSLDYRSHQTRTCGLHIHVNRKAFGNDYDSQENSISHIVHFVEMH